MNYAGLIRPVIDRVYVSLRAAAASRARAVYTERGLRRGVIDSDYYFAILDHPLPADAVEAALAYRSVDLAAEAAHGIAALEDGSWHLTGPGRGLCEALQAAIGDGAEELWSWSRRPMEAVVGLEALPRLNELVGRLLEAGQATGGAAFAAMTPVFEPDGASQATILSSRLGALRHHRADAHRAAWAGAGLTAEEIKALAPGPERARIEADTDRRDAPVYLALSDEERLELLARLGALPDMLR